jgi:hypothetical protein
MNNPLNKMKTYIIKPAIVILFIFLLFSCKKENNSDGDGSLKIEFSNGTIITQNDIVFYDSSTRIFFLKNNLPDQKFTSFDVKLKNQTIYSGQHHACELSSLPKSDIYISGCFLYGSDILEIGAYQGKEPMVNDSRIIQYLESKKLLKKGISCSIKNIEVLNYPGYSKVTCKISLKNHDNNNYYIPDPAKMGESKFSYYTGGLNFYNTGTNTYSFLKWTSPVSDWYTVALNDLSVLKAGAETEIIFTSTDYHSIEKGNYRIRFVFPGLRYSTSTFDLNQSGGRIWVGESLSVLENYVLD